MQTEDCHCPREGYKHPFIFHGILAFSAAYKVHSTQIQSKKDRYLELCGYYYTLGLKPFQCALQAITDDNWLAIFSFASVLVLYIFILSVRSAQQTRANPTASFLDLVSLL